MERVSSCPVPCSTSEEDWICAVGELSSNDKYVCVSIQDGSLHIFSAVDGTYVMKLANPFNQPGPFKFKEVNPWDKRVWSHAIVDDMVVVGDKYGVLRTWHIPEGALIHEVQPIPVDIDAVPGDEYSPAGISRLDSLPSSPGSVLAATVSGSTHQWVIGSAIYRRSFTGEHETNASKIEHYDNGNRFVSIDTGRGSLEAWDVNTGSSLWHKPRGSLFVSCAIGNGVVAMGREDGQIIIAKLEDGAEIAAFDAHKGYINGLIFSENLLISTGIDGFAKVWSMPASGSAFELQKSEKLYDHAVTARHMLGSCLVTAGKHGGGPENSCGLDCRMKIWRVHGDEASDKSGPAEEVDLPVAVIWDIIKSPSPGSIAISVMRRGKPAFEIWKMV